MKTAAFVLSATALLLAGCSGSSGLSTSSIFGGSKPDPAMAQAAPGQPSDPTARAFQVGTVSARALKCGYNFDAAKLRTSFLAAESAQLPNPADLQRIEKVYDVAFNGVTKAVAGQSDYCNDTRTKEIKADLTRHLAGDYQPNTVKKVAAKQDGFFGGLFEGDGVKESGPSFGSDDWWSKQGEKVGQ